MNDDYFGWLCALTAGPRNRKPQKTYFQLLHQLHSRQFSWFVHNDDNRGEDGKELRDEYLDWAQIEGDDFFFSMDASVLEVLIALSRRVAFESYGSAADWFWKLLENLDLQHYTDSHFNEQVANDVEHTLDVVLDRRYGYDGRGGLFPLRRARTDQRRTELWYQMSAYVLEGLDVANGP